MSRQIICFAIVASLLGLVSSPAVHSQEQPAAAPPSFEELHDQWSKLNARLDEVIKTYRSAGFAERERLVKEYNELVSQSKELLPSLRLAALLAYKAAPNEDDQVTKTLVGIVANDVRSDDFEAALGLAKTLYENNCQEPALDTFVGIAAYCTDDFAAAEAHLKKAEAAGLLTPVAEVCLKDLETAKTAWDAEQTIRQQESEADDLPHVKMETSKGAIVIELYENEAPGTVGNFVSLVQKKYYDGLTFHRVLPGFMAQGGCPDGNGGGGPGYEILCECRQENHRKHFRGTLSMAHAGPDTGGSQFFLTFKRTAHLDGLHTVFGRVIEGLDVLAQLERRNPSQGGTLPEPDKIVKAEVVRKREHEYEPTKSSD
jgi:cyclophilin family peptidyl-prolyl cis-trans isomerase